MDEILNIIHKTIYQFIDASEDDVLMSEKDKLLLKVNKAICNNLKAFNVHNTNAGDLISRRAVIEWLKDKDIIKTKNQEENARRELAELPSTQPTCNQLATDCISRQELLNAISQKEYGHDYDEDTDILGLKYVDIINGMPSVKLETCGDCISRQAALECLDWKYPDKLPKTKIIELPSVEPEKDCISRQAVLDLAERGKLVSNGNYKSVCDAINALPSVEPERKMGHWEDCSNGWMCSECKHDVTYTTKYCPNCWARMEVEG